MANKPKSGNKIKSKKDARLIQKKSGAGGGDKWFFVQKKKKSKMIYLKLIYIVICITHNDLNTN